MPAAPRLLLPVLVCFIALSVGSGTMVNVALPFIGADLGADAGTYGWVVSGFSLTFGIFSAVHGRLGDVFGLRRLYLIGTALFGLTALASAMAPTMATLIALRIVQGAAAAAIPSLGTTIIARSFAPEHRGAAIGTVVATVGVTASIAPFIGGAVLQFAHWRFTLAAPALGLLLIPFAQRALPAQLDEVSSGQRFDPVGATLLGLGAASLLVGLDQLRRGGIDASTMAAWGIGATLLGVFLVWIRYAEAPFAPPALIGDRRFIAASLTGAMANAGRFGTTVLVPILLVDVEHVSPFAVGAALLPGAAVLTVLSRPAGRLTTRYGARRVVMPASIALALSCVLASATAHLGVPGLALSMTAFGAAFAFVQPPLLGSLGGFLPRESLGVGNGLYLMLFFLGGAFGVAFSLTALGLQPPGVAPWFGAAGPTAPFANAMLALGALAMLPLPFLRWLPLAETLPPVAQDKQGERGQANRVGA